MNGLLLKIPEPLNYRVLLIYEREYSFQASSHVIMNLIKATYRGKILWLTPQFILNICSLDHFSS